MVSTHSRPKAAGFFSQRVRSKRVRFQHTAARRRLVRAYYTDKATGQFQHTAARRRLVRPKSPRPISKPCFNTQPPEGGWACSVHRLRGWTVFQHTAARRRLDGTLAAATVGGNVSTHSRPKAAGPSIHTPKAATRRFNTQPPEGGWFNFLNLFRCPAGFNTQPPEGGWQLFGAGGVAPVCFNTQPPEGGWFQVGLLL